MILTWLISDSRCADWSSSQLRSGDNEFLSPVGLFSTPWFYGCAGYHRVQARTSWTASRGLVTISKQRSFFVLGFGVWPPWLAVRSQWDQNGTFSLIAGALRGARRGSGTRGDIIKARCACFCSSLKINLTEQGRYFAAQQPSPRLLCYGRVLAIACQSSPHAQRKQSRGFPRPTPSCRGLLGRVTRTKCSWHTSVLDKIPLELVSVINWSAIRHKAMSKGKINTGLSLRNMHLLQNICEALRTWQP